MLNRRVNKATDLCAFGVEVKLHSIQAVNKPEHSTNVTVTAVPSIRSTRLQGGTSNTVFGCKTNSEHQSHNLNSTAAILCKSNNFGWNVYASIAVCFWSVRADKMFNQKLFYRKQLKKWKKTEACIRTFSAPFCRVSHINSTQLLIAINVITLYLNRHLWDTLEVCKLALWTASLLPSTQLWLVTLQLVTAETVEGRNLKFRNISWILPSFIKIHK